MNGVFLDLRDDEIDLIYRTPALVTLLVAGADGKIETKELRSAIRFVSEPQGFWAPYFLELTVKMPIFLEPLTKEASDDLEHTLAKATFALRQLNRILPKLPKEDAVKFHDFLLRLAKEVASATGGMFGFNKISKEEALVLSLPMLDNPSYIQYC